MQKKTNRVHSLLFDEISEICTGCGFREKLIQTFGDQKEFLKIGSIVNLNSTL